MSKLHTPQICRFIAEASIARSNELAPAPRADLFEALSEILQGEAAEEAKLTAFNIRETERHQMTLEQFLREGK